MRIVYCRVPELMDAEMHRLVDEWKRYIPGWATLLTVDYDDSDSEDFCTVDANYQHRVIHLCVHPLMVTLDRTERDLTFLHELGHALHAVVDEAVEQILETRMPRKAAERVYGDAVEAFVTDHASLAWFTTTGGKE